jgi:hypothetical protein
MVDGVREFLKTSGGKGVAIGVTLLALAVCVWSIINTLGDSDAVAVAGERMFVCSETGKGFEYTLVAGDTIPVQSPHSGKRTGYPAELCYWTKDGKVKEHPTAVLMNAVVNKPDPTFCPECHRIVVRYNPRPLPGATPPPLRSEYKPRAAPAE